MTKKSVDGQLLPVSRKFSIFFQYKNFSLKMFREPSIKSFENCRFNTRYVHLRTNTLKFTDGKYAPRRSKYFSNQNNTIIEY